MKKTIQIGIVVVLLCLITIPIKAQSCMEKNEPLASKLVNQCANIHENDFVLITGSARDMGLMNEIYLQTRKVGAFPLIRLLSQERSLRYYDVVSEKFDSKADKFNEAIAELIDVQIGISTAEELDLFDDVPTNRIVTRNTSYQNANDIIRDKNVRGVALGNGLYPTDALAEQYGITKDELATQFWNGINTDYNRLYELGNTIKEILKKGNKIQITDNNGTNIKMEIDARPVMVSDGMISDDEEKEGFPACLVWLPAGEVYLAPVKGTAKGKIVVENVFFMGKPIEGLTLKFKAGKLISMSAKSGLDDFKEFYDAAGEGKGEFAFIDIGINPDVQIIPDSRMVAWMASGVVTIGHGANGWAGGDNTVSYGASYHLNNATVKVDGKTIVKNGEIII